MAAVRQTLFSDAVEIKFKVQRSLNNGFERTADRSQAYPRLGSGGAAA